MTYTAGVVTDHRSYEKPRSLCSFLVERLALQRLKHERMKEREEEDGRECRWIFEQTRRSATFLFVAAHSQFSLSLLSFSSSLHFSFFSTIAMAFIGLHSSQHEYVPERNTIPLLTFFHYQRKHSSFVFAELRSNKTFPTILSIAFTLLCSWPKEIFF